MHFNTVLANTVVQIEGYAHVVYVCYISKWILFHAGLESYDVWRIQIEGLCHYEQQIVAFATVDSVNMAVSPTNQKNTKQCMNHNMIRHVCKHVMCMLTICC